MDTKDRRQELMELANAITDTAKQRKARLDSLAFEHSSCDPDEEDCAKINAVIEENTTLLNDLLAKVREFTGAEMTDDEILSMCLLQATVMFDLTRLDSNELFGYLNRKPVAVSDVIESAKTGSLQRYCQLTWSRGEYCMEPTRAVVEFFGG